VGEYDFVIKRSSDYLNWRYADPRGGKHRVFAAEQDGTVLGFVAIKVTGARGFIMDIFARPGRDDAVRSLLNQAEEAFRAAGVIVGECWIPPNHPYRKLLTRFGYFDTRQPSGASADTFEGPQKGSLSMLREERGRLHLMMGDLD
jgi:hypothetical protein